MELIGQGIKNNMKGGLALMKLNNQFKNKLKIKVKDVVPDGQEPEEEYEDPPPLEQDEIKNAMKIID